MPQRSKLRWEPFNLHSQYYMVLGECSFMTLDNTQQKKCINPTTCMYHFLEHTLTDDRISLIVVEIHHLDMYILIFFLGGRNPHMKSHYRGHHVAVWLQLIPQLHQPGGVAEVPIGIHHQFDGQQDPSTDQLYEGEIERNNYILPAGIMHLFCIIQVSFECRE